MNLSICIPTYNRLQDLKACLASVFSAITVLEDIEPVEVLVSDNASLDGTGEWLTQVRPSNQKIVFLAWTNCENIGAARNVKELLGKASGKYVFFLTDDDLVLPRAFEITRNHILSDSPQYIQLANITYSKKSKRSFYYGPDRNLKDKHDPVEFVRLCKYSHVLSGCIVRNRPELVELLNRGKNAYPSIEFCALSAGHCVSVAEPLIWHQWENEIFWDVDVDTSTESLRNLQLNRDAQLALRHIPDGFLDANAVQLLYKDLLDAYGYVEADIQSKFRKLSTFELYKTKGKLMASVALRNLLRRVVR